MLWSTGGAAVISQTRWLCCASLLQGMGCKHRGMRCCLLERCLMVEQQSLVMDFPVFWELQVFLNYAF